jgi:hypothetical protein
MDKEAFDTVAGYCRMLGHEVTFSYCRTVREGLFCHRILDCWFERIPVREFVERFYSPGEREIAFRPPESRMVTLYDLIRKANARKQEG